MCIKRMIWEAEIQTAKPLIPEPTTLEVEIEIGKLKKYKTPGMTKFRQN